MEGPPPNTAFSNTLAKGIYDQRKDSVFCIKFTTKNATLMLQMLQTLGNYSTVKKGKEACKKISHATGFLVGQNNEVFQILTCAHSIEHLYTALQSFSPEYLNSVLEVSVMCDHQEQTFRQKKRSDTKFAVANIVQINCKKDLLLLSVERKYVENLLNSTCELEHPIVPFANNFPSPLEKVLMISWPPKMNRTTALGYTSHASRNFGDLTQSNELGYTMKLGEVDIAACPGGSGGPLFDSGGNWVGIVQGKAGAGTYAAFIALSDIRRYLSSWGVAQ